jgi:colanic acid/amylovoran biosynthesis glycosyltransferase
MNSLVSTRPVLGYLVSRYPAVSHTFILREIAMLRILGFSIHTASINPPDRALSAMDEAERIEAQNTYVIKTHGAFGAMSALWALVRYRPRALLSLVNATWKLRMGWRAWAYALEAAMVALWMHKHRLRHLHVHFGNVGATVGILVKAINQCHLSLTVHGPDEFDDVKGQRLAEKMAAADAVICISQFARGQLMRISDMQHWHKFRVCRLGVDLQQFACRDSQPEHETVKLLCTGRLTPAKGQLVLLQACALLRQRQVDFHLTLVGDGPDRAAIQATVSQLNLSSVVELTGSVVQARVRQYLQDADVFVLPSFAEGIPVVLMEAMASGVVCVSSPVNGIPELIENGHTGLLSAPGDVEQLARSLMTLIQDAPKRQQLAKAAREKVEDDFDLQRNVRALARHFEHFPSPPDA